jgi:hypothetical protein
LEALRSFFIPEAAPVTRATPGNSVMAPFSALVLGRNGPRPRETQPRYEMQGQFMEEEEGRFAFFWRGTKAGRRSDENQGGLEADKFRNTCPPGIVYNRSGVLNRTLIGKSKASLYNGGWNLMTFLAS